MSWMADKLHEANEPYFNKHYVNEFLFQLFQLQKAALYSRGKSAAHKNVFEVLVDVF